MNEHKVFMQRAIDLAQMGLGQVKTNPLVGCIIAENGRVVAEGYHRKYGGAHAEVEALNQLNPSVNPKLCTMYVSLEPCNHFGKTGPCTEAIIRSGIPKIYIATNDPNPLVNMQGVQKLKENGIEVNLGLLEKESLSINKRFACLQKNKRPYIILKWAETLNGYMDNRTPGTAHNSALKITSPLEDALVHQWRAEEDAILVGAGTISQDNPSLTVRHIDGESPVRIGLFNNTSDWENKAIGQGDVATYFFNTLKEGVEGKNTWIRMPKNYKIMDCLHFFIDKPIGSILVEGGKKILEAMIQEHLWDEIRVFRHQFMLVDEGVKAPELPFSTAIQKKRMDVCDLIILENR